MGFSVYLVDTDSYKLSQHHRKATIARKSKLSPTWLSCLYSH